MLKFTTNAQRIGKVKGEILAHAAPVEVLGITGVQKKMPKNAGETIVFRRWLPYGATASAPNTWVLTSQAHVTQEGVTPDADSLTPQDVQVSLTQYACLYGVTDRTVDLYEDDVPAEMKKQTGERMGLVRELVRYGVLKSGTNAFYAGGTSRTTVSAGITIPLLRKVTRSLRAAHTKMVTSILSPSTLFGTAPVEAAWLVFCHTDCESNIRDLPKFIHISEYGNRKPVHEAEIGSCESFRFIMSPELTPYLAAGAAVAGSGLTSVGAANIDVYPMIVTSEEAWGQVALRGGNSIDPTWIPPGQKDKTDPLGQRGYVGAKFYHACIVLNQGWMAVVETGVTDLSS